MGARLPGGYLPTGHLCCVRALQTDRCRDDLTPQLSPIPSPFALVFLFLSLWFLLFSFRSGFYFDGPCQAPKNAAPRQGDRWPEVLVEYERQATASECRRADPKGERLGTCLPLRRGFGFSTVEGQGDGTEVSGWAGVAGVVGDA